MKDKEIGTKRISSIIIIGVFHWEKDIPNSGIIKLFSKFKNKIFDIK